LGNTEELKIADFGLARAFGIPIRPYTKEVVTLWYRAPELLLGSTEYSTPVDLWSVGCIFAEVISKRALFDGDSEQDQIRKIFRIMGTPTDEVWPGVSSLPGFQQIQWQQYERMDLKKVVKYLDQVLDEAGIDLLYKLLTYDPTQRISAIQALKHEYFKDL
jgi:cyclin-dependent kinase 2